jgi:glycosyltransferase involved in cell wall biosynthesis
MIRVCHLIHSLQPGGAEELLLTLARAAPGAGIDVRVVSLLPARSRVAAELAASGVDVASIGLSGRWDPRAFRRATGLLRAAGPDLVHTHLKHADIVGSVAAARLGVPMVSTLHVIEDVPGVLGRVKRRAGARARTRRAARTIAVSDAQRAWYLAAVGGDPGRVVTVHNGVAAPPTVDEAQRAALRGALGAAPGDVVAAMVGVMRPGKGHDDLLAVARALGPRAGLRFAVVGDGPGRARFEARVAEQAGLAAPVVLTGWRDDVPALLQAVDLVVHPSHADALPTALIEALAAARPSVAYAVGGVPEVVDDTSGVLVPPGDTDALAGVVRALASDPARRARLGEGARRRFDEEFHVDRWVGRLRELYTDVLDAHRAGRAA